MFKLKRDLAPNLADDAVVWSIFSQPSDVLDVIVDDPLRTARGIFDGFLVSLALWTMITLLIRDLYF